MIRPYLLAAAPLAISLAACSQGTTQPPAGESATPTAGPTSPASVAPARPTATEKDAALRLEGLGDLVVGEKVPATSSFALRGAQASDSCLIYTSPDYPGLYAMVEGGTLRRITVGNHSPVRLIEGIGIGSTESEVLSAFPGFVSEPHKYVEAPAKYLTQPGDDPRLRFEINSDRTVVAVHVGVSPQLQYVEGCA